MSQWYINLNDMRDFLPFLANSCNSFCENQEMIDRSYNTVIEVWSDNVCRKTGGDIRETANQIRGFYDYLKESIDAIKKFCDNRADYNDEEELYLPPIDEFKVNIQEDSRVNNGSIINDSETLAEFSKALDSYIESLVDNVGALDKQYVAIGETWRDKKYEEFGEVLQEFKNNMQTQINVLDEELTYFNNKIEKHDSEE